MGNPVDITSTIISQLNIYDKNIPDTFNLNNKEKLNIIDEELNKKVLNTILTPLGITPINELDFIKKMRASDIYLIINTALTIRGLKQKWVNTALSFKEVADNELSAKIEVLFHYISTALREFGVDSPDWIIDNFNKEEITVSLALNRAKDIILSLNVKPENQLKFEIKEDIDYLKNYIIEANSRINPKIFSYIELILEKNPNKISGLDVNKIKFKENKIKIIKLFVENKIELKINNIEDVVRLMIENVTREPHLLYTKKLRNTMVEPRNINYYWKLLNISFKINGNEEKLIKLYKQKRKLFNKLMNLYQYKSFVDKYEVVKLLRRLKNRKGKISNPKYKTPYKILNEIIERDNISEKFLITFLDKNQFLFTDKTLHVIAAIKKHFINDFSYIKKLNLKLKHFIRIYNYLSSKDLIDDNEKIKYLYIMPHSVYGKDLEPQNMVNKEDIKKVKNILLELIKEKINKNIREFIWETYKNEGKLYIFDYGLIKELDNIKVPFAADTSLSTTMFERGTYFNFNGDILRVGIYWENYKNVRVDLDLAAGFTSEDFDKMQVLGWNCLYTLPNTSAVFSGDVIDGKYGAAEFIDVNLKKVKDLGFRYIVLTINNYSAAGYNVSAYTGLMELDENEFLKAAGEVGDSSRDYFNPQKIKIQNNVILKKSYGLLGIMDIKEMIYYPLNIQGGYLNRTSLLDNMYLLYIIDRIKLESKSNISLKDLYRLIDEETKKIHYNIKDENIIKVDNLNLFLNLLREKIII